LPGRDLHADLHENEVRCVAIVVDRSTTKITSFLYVITGVTAIAGFLYGYDTGIISGALLPISSEFHLGHRIQEIVASSILVGAVLGALSCGTISERIGRKRTIMTVACIFCAGSLASSLSPSPLLLSLSRILLGFAVGGSSQVTPMYIAELAPPARRGRLVISFNLSIGIGILVANIVGFTLQDIWSWRWMIAAAVFPAIILFLCMLRLPESPRWLAENISIESARGVLERVRDNGADVEFELAEIRQVVDAGGSGRKAGWSMLAEPWLRPAAVAAFGVAAFTQLSGLETMIYYTPTVLSGAGFGKSAALLASLGVSIVFVSMTAIGRQIVDRVGRRRLTLVMVPGTVVSLIVLGIMFRMDMAKTAQGSWLLVVCLLVYMVFNAGGVQVIGWLMGSEMFPLAIRGKASSVHAATLWGSNLIITSTALSMVSVLGVGGAMWVYAGLNFLGFLFVWRFVPETTGHSLEDIENHLRAGKFMSLRMERTVQ
jgi:sugar porter (SP) family MFS transporter